MCGFVCQNSRLFGGGVSKVFTVDEIKKAHVLGGLVSKCFRVLGQVSLQSRPTD